MNPYFFTITFLALMGVLTSSEMVRHHTDSFEKKCYLSSCTNLKAAEEARVISQIEELRRAESDDPKPRGPRKKGKYEPRHAKALGINFARPPDNSRLNLYFLFKPEPTEKTKKKKLPEGFSLYNVMARLICLLYQEEEFYIPGVEYRLLDKLLEKKETILTFTTPDQLAELNLEDPYLQKIFHQMLKGTRKSSSLLNYITHESIETNNAQNRKINYLFADSLIIHAIFPERHIAQQLIEHRDELLEKIAYQEAYRLSMSIDSCKGRQAFSDELKRILTNTLDSAGKETEKYLSYVFDCTIGHPGSVIFIENSQTHQLTREKYIPPSR